MKNLILKNYDINIDKIVSKDDNTFFFYNNIKIYIVLYNDEITYLEYLFKLSNELYFNGIKVNTFLLNNESKMYTKIDNNNIVLMRENQIENDVCINDLLKFERINNNLKSFNIYHEWQNEIDLIEKELIEYNKEYELIRESIDYFIGMGENAIELMEEYQSQIDINNDSIAHYLTYKLFSDNSINNPFTFIKANRMYDRANLIKYKFYKNEIDLDQIEEIFSECNEYESVYLFSCLLYSSEYFDLVKKVLLDKESENKLIFYINRIDSYKKMLSYCKKYVKNKKVMKLLNWL